MAGVGSVERFLEGGGACGALIATLDWSASPLGPIASWPAALRATVANMLHTRQPMLLFWGPELIQVYNDSFVPSFGLGKHPAAMGQRARVCWEEVWPVVGAQIEAVMARGEPAWHEDALIPIYRNGRMEEVFWTYSYSPAYDDDGEGRGTLVIVTEMTGRVVGARRLASLSRLGAALSLATAHHGVFLALLDFAARSPDDVPFLLVLDASERDGPARAHGIGDADARELGAALSRHDEAREAQVIALPHGVPGPVWPEPVETALTISIGRYRFAFGLSPRLPVDEAYRSYLAQVVEQIGSALRRIDNHDASIAMQRQRDELLMHAPIATALLTGPDHVYQLANPLYLRLVGRDPVGKRFAVAFPELVGSEFAGMLDRVHATGAPVTLDEARVSLGPEGAREERYVNFALEPLRDRGGDVYGIMAVVVDVTDLVRARQAVEKIAAERSLVMAALQQANRAKDEFLAMLGHELRNPLAPIVTAIDLMKQKDATPSNERAVIERQLRRVVRLVDDLLDVSKITRGVITLEKRPIDLAEVVRAAVEETTPAVEQRGHRLFVDAERGAFVDGDEARLVQVVSNLLTNAARYTPPGGEIHVTLSRTGDEGVVAVRDNGAGIPADLLPTIFETFVQGARSPDRAEGGLGLGLAIVKSLVQLHGGTVAAESRGRGRGSVFTIRLALTDRRPDRPSAAPGGAKAAVCSRRVLVVDDNEDAANLLGEVARMRGHDVTVVHDPSEALAMATDLAPEVAVLDIGLPGMDGYELAQRLHAIVPDCRLIALTGYGQDKDRNESRRAGFAAHLVKPVSLPDLLDALAAGSAPPSGG